ncbi:MAG TPA: hypothetical protein DCQ98_07960 [Planctomycetaceae bacterium]|nr:hypothetical protein [Planctomycetaceae bacterium]
MDARRHRILTAFADRSTRMSDRDSRSLDHLSIAPPPGCRRRRELPVARRSGYADAVSRVPSAKQVARRAGLVVSRTGSIRRAIDGSVKR